MAVSMDKWKLGTRKATLQRRALSGFADIPEDAIMTSSKDKPVSMPKRFLRRLSQVTGIERPAAVTDKLLNSDVADDNAKQTLELSRGVCLIQDSPLRILRVSPIITTHDIKSRSISVRVHFVFNFTHSETFLISHAGKETSYVSHDNSRESYVIPIGD